MAIISQKKISKTRLPNCSVCGNRLHSRTLLTRCIHPVCIECAAPHFKELKDLKCPDCNTFDHILAKFHSCLAESTNFNISAEADRLKKAEEAKSKDIRGKLQVKLDRLDAFDSVGTELAKVGRV